MPLTAQKYGSYAGCFKKLLGASAQSLKDEFPGIESGIKLTACDVIQEEQFPNLDDIDAIMITGSRGFFFCEMFTF